jgi:hypothetical protein
MRQDCGIQRSIKIHVATTHPLHSGDAHIGINSGAGSEVKPCIVTVNAVKKVDNGGGIVQCENYEGL